MAKDVYCVINSYDEYFKVFDSLDKAKKDIVKRLHLLSAEQIEEDIKKESLSEKDVFLQATFLDNYQYHQIIPTKDMLFYFSGATYNYRRDSYVREYILFEEDDFTNFKDFFYFDGWYLIKTQVL